MYLARFSYDVLPANREAATLLLTGHLWVRVYVPEAWLGLIKLDEHVRYFRDLFVLRPATDEGIVVGASTDRIGACLRRLHCCSPWLAFTVSKPMASLFSIDLCPSLNGGGFAHEARVAHNLRCCFRIASLE